MTHYTVIGTSYQQSTVAYREKLAFSPEEIQRFLPAIVNTGVIQECSLLSNCNRTEIYFVSEDPNPALSLMFQSLAPFKDEAASALFAEGYQYHNRDCARHLLRVAAGLESQMVGETQILHQVKNAHQLASAAGAAGRFLNRLFNFAVQAGKRVRHETAIGVGAISIGSAAVELVRRKLAPQENATVILLGAGEMAEQAALHLTAKKQAGVRLLITSRTRQRAEVLAQRVRAESLAWEKLPQTLPEASAVIAATSAPQPVLRPEHFSSRQDAARRSLLCIDIGLPRNIDPAVAQLPQVRLYDLDHLNGVIDKNLQIRLAELPKAEKIIDELLAEFGEWYHALKVVPVIKSLLQYGDEIRQQEIARNRKNFQPEEWQHLDALTSSLMNKLLQMPIQRLKAWANDPQLRDRELEAVCEFFALGENLVSKNSAPRHAAE
ncbi:MAG: glutamyl-tRNA reductase [candidate division KSB1 bacterium]|nr:glutamyl-tRNA reductase [candidate division KSB1 bacterium]